MRCFLIGFTRLVPFSQEPTLVQTLKGKGRSYLPLQLSPEFSLLYPLHSNILFSLFGSDFDGRCHYHSV